MHLDKALAIAASTSSIAAVACATSASPKPFANSLPDTADVYLYGSPQSLAPERAAPPAPGSAVAKKAPGPSASTQAAAATRRERREASAAANDEEDAKSGKETIVSIAGEYRGTDWVTISLPGLPEDEQEDDKARVIIKRVAASDEGDDTPASSADGGGAAVADGRYSLSVIDTNSGDELCTLDGERTGSVIALPPGQTCFSGILGVPMAAKTLPGEAHIDGLTLSVEFAVELRVQTPNAALEGSLDYSFEGQKVE